MRNKKYLSGSQSGYKSNVMTPINWFAGTTETILLPTAGYNHDNWFGIASFSLAVIIIFYYAYIYNYWSKKSPDRLQTEGYNLATNGLFISDDSVESKIINPDEHEVIEIDISEPAVEIDLDPS